MTHKNDHGLQAWVGSALRIRRLAAGLTLKEFSQKVGVSTATVARWETDTNSPDAQSVQLISEQLRSEPIDFSRAPRVV